MLITFHSKAAADILMRSDDVDTLLRAAGKTYGEKVPERGVFTRDQLAGAIAGLERAIQAEPPVAEDADEQSDKGPAHPVDQHVALHQRAFPLLDMLRKSLAAGHDVTWESSRGW